jgi:HAD superfamily hydrolase (TIGR01490 family)
MKPPTATRPFAVFDIDGTLIRWQLYHALADELARRGLMAADSYQQVRDARMQWKTRSHHMAFEEYENLLVRHIDELLVGLPVRDFRAACQSVVAVYKDQVYTYTRDLLRQLKDQEYLLFAISASQAEIVGLVAEYYGFDDFGGTSLEAKEGRYTGRKHLLFRDKKPKLLRQLVTKHRAHWKDSIGIGDSEGDIPMLSIVERPIAFNPTRPLSDHATTQGWEIVVERKNVIYELKATDHGYHLTA